MTLVVARLVTNDITIASDLRVTDPDEIRRGYPYGVLKVLALAPDLCVAFAGSVEEALDTIRSLPRPASSEAFPDIVEQLSRRTSAARRRAEYLVASTNPSRLARVCDGLIEHGSSVWIGDRAAFTEYQRLVHDPNRTRPSLPDGQPMTASLEVASSMSQAMTVLVSSETISSVGEAAVFLGTTNARLFEYRTHAEVRAVSQSIPSGQPTPIRFGSAAEGGFAFSVLTPTQPGVAAIGIHFAQGQVGLLYAPLAGRDPVAYPLVNHDQFRAVVRTEHGIDIEGLKIG
jgi:hypothetical protein